MRIRPVMLVGVLTAALFAAGSTAALAQCVTCDTNPGGHCVIVASGHGSCTSAYYPDDFCKLACPNCPTQACDPGGGGGGGGDCGGEFSLSPINDQTVVTLGVVIRSNAIASGRIFRLSGNTRVLRGAAVGGMSVADVLQKVREAGGNSVIPINLAYAFQNVNEIAMPTRFATSSGDGFSFATAGRGMTSRVQLRPRSDRVRVIGRPEETEVGADDLLLLNLRIDGQPYILVLRSESISRTAPDLARRVDQLQSRFRDSIGLVRPGAQPLIMKIPVC